MLDLIVKITGEVSESTFPEFKKEALEMIKAADHPLVSDEDFLEAEQVVKDCSVAEKAIKSAKDEALSQTVDISKLFAGLDEISETLRSTRLSLNKSVKKEKASRKLKIVDSGVFRLTDAIEVVAIDLPLITNVIGVRRDVFEDAVSGKKKLESMLEAVDGVLEFELERLEQLKNNVSAVLISIRKTEEEYPGLFPDVNILVEKDISEIGSIIDGRVAKFKLAANEKAEKERKAKEDAEKKRVEQEKVAVEKEPAVQQHPPEQKEPAKQHEPDEVKTYSPNVNHNPEQFAITIIMSCTTDDAKYVSRLVDDSIGKSEFVDSISLKRC